MIEDDIGREGDGFVCASLESAADDYDEELREFELHPTYDRLYSLVRSIRSLKFKLHEALRALGSEYEHKGGRYLVTAEETMEAITLLPEIVLGAEDGRSAHTAIERHVREITEDVMRECRQHASAA